MSTESRESPSRKRGVLHLLDIDIVPDPDGWVGFVVASGIVLSYLALPAGEAGYLFSCNPFLEVLGHAWLLLGPPVALYLGVRHLLVRGDSLLPLLTVPLALFLTMITGLGVLLGVLAGGS